MAARRYTLVDVFTSTRLQGNPLAVVHDADGLPDPLMHAFARETRLSETSFVQTADAPGADYRNRIWAMTGELPFAGHPSRTGRSPRRAWPFASTTPASTRSSRSSAS